MKKDLIGLIDSKLAFAVNLRVGALLGLTWDDMDISEE